MLRLRLPIIWNTLTPFPCANVKLIHLFGSDLPLQTSSKFCPQSIHLYVSPRGGEVGPVSHDGEGKLGFLPVEGAASAAAPLLPSIVLEGYFQPSSGGPQGKFLLC